MARFRTLEDLEVAGRTVLVRLDLNVPMKDGEVADATRIERSVPTVKELLDKGAKVVVLAHFGRPKGKREPSMSLAPLAQPLGQALGGIEVRSPRTASASRRSGPSRRCGPARSCCSRTCASTPGRRRTIRRSPISSRASATSMSTMRSRPRIARMPRSPAWRSVCRPRRAV